MIKAFLVTIGIIFAMAGLCELIYILRLLIASPKGIRNNYTVLMLRESFAEAQLRFCAAQLKWLGGSFAQTVIAVTDGISKEKLREYSAVFTDGFVFCPSEALGNVILSLSK